MCRSARCACVPVQCDSQCCYNHAKYPDMMVRGERWVDTSHFTLLLLRDSDQPTPAQSWLAWLASWPMQERLTWSEDQPPLAVSICPQYHLSPRTLNTTMVPALTTPGHGLLAICLHLEWNDQGGRRTLNNYYWKTISICSRDWALILIK